MVKKSCYDLLLRDAWYPEFFFSKIQKQNKVPRWYAIPIQSHMSYKFEKPFHICNLSSHWALSNCCDPLRESFHRHVHSHAILLHLEDSKYIPYPSTNKTPRCAIFISLQSYHHNVWAIQKEIKDAYPKKVCHMPTRHVKKKREKRCIPKEGMPHTHKVCQKRERERNKI